MDEYNNFEWTQKMVLIKQDLSSSKKIKKKRKREKNGEKVKIMKKPSSGSSDFVS